MSFQVEKEFIAPTVFSDDIITNDTNFLLDAEGEKVAAIFEVPETGTITAIAIRTGNITTSADLLVGLETLSNGVPSRTQYGGSSPGTITSPAANTVYEVTLPNPASAVKGDRVAIVVQFASTAGNLYIARSTRTPAFPYIAQYTTSWVKAAKGMCCGIKYSDGLYRPIGHYPTKSRSQWLYNVNSTPDERALKFKLPFPARVCGAIYLQHSSSGPGDVDIVLYDPNNNVLTSYSLPSTDRVDASLNTITIYFPTPVVIEKDTFYRLSLKPTTTTGIYLRYFDVANADMMNAYPMGQNAIYSYRTDEGVWTDDPTVRPAIAVILDAFDDGTGSGGGGVVGEPSLVFMG